MAQDMNEIEYSRARTLMYSDKLDEIIIARDIFEKLDNYKDSNKYLSETNLKIKDKEKDLEQEKIDKYDRACMLMENKKSAQRLDQAIKLFSELEDYKDSPEKAQECKDLRIKVAKKDKKDLNNMKAAGLFCACIGLVFLALLICGFIWAFCFK